MSENKRPKVVNSASDKELLQAQENFDAFDESIKSLTMDRLNEAPKQDLEPQTQLSQTQIKKDNATYLKPHRTIRSHEKFNERFREKYNFDKEYVNFVAENREIIGEDIELWTKPYPGLPAEMWIVPTNKPIWGPRYLAEQIKRKYYHRLVMKNTVTGGSSNVQYYGSMASDTTIQRLDAVPVSTRSTISFNSNFPTAK